MKRLIAMALVTILLSLLTACNNGNKEETATRPDSAVELDIEMLKTEWTEGVIAFANGNTISLPCTLQQLKDASGIDFANPAALEGKTLAPHETYNASLVSDDTCLKLICVNKGEEEIALNSAAIVRLNYFNYGEGDRQITLAGTLSIGTYRADVEEALGAPKISNEEKTLYIYKGKNKNKQSVELTVGFNSEGLVNSVSFEIDK